MRPLWRDLILQIWPAPRSRGEGWARRSTRIPLWQWDDEARPESFPPPPFDIDTMKPVNPPWQAIKEWIPDDEPDLEWFNRPRNSSNHAPDAYDQRPAWHPPEAQLDDDRVLVLEYS